MSSIVFPIAAIVFSLYAFWFPEWLSQQKSLIAPCLIVIMFSMGLTLRKEDFVRVIKQPGVIGIGTLLQYSVMPLAAYLIAVMMDFSPELTAGMVLLGATAGGTASNVICYLAGGNVALSITLTAVSTLLAVFATPFLTWLYLDQVIDVPVTKMLVSVLEIVFVPITLGILCNYYLHKSVLKIQPYLPLVSMLSIIFVIGIIVALNHERIATIGFAIVFAIFLHNAIGLASGYWVSRLFKYDDITARTVAIEVGMQNSGLSVALAMTYFGSLAALPGALFSIWHNVSGAILAAWWKRKSALNLNK